MNSLNFDKEKQLFSISPKRSFDKKTSSKKIMKLAEKNINKIFLDKISGKNGSC